MFAPSGPLPGGRGVYEVRFQGRGGQGTVVASVLLAQAAFLEGRGVQAFPFFGVERRGAPVVAHTRVVEGTARPVCSVPNPDALVVMDPSLIAGSAAPLLKGLGPGATVLLNTTRSAKELGLPPSGPRVTTFDATALAREYRLGSPASPIVNTAILGAFARLTGIVRLPSLEQAIADKVPARTSENQAAARGAFQRLQERAT
jgi:2-oxoacid:acceptor oxidoreductase gamma subunit (pyruvate/2-ketoisovalerate family)